jgi:putative ABC transport system permease protein
MNDLKFAFRQLLKNPGFTAVAVLTLALGIGANTAIFSMADSALWRPLPFTEPRQLIVLGEGNLQERSRGGASAANFRNWRAQARSFSAFAALSTVSFNLSGSGAPERLIGGQVTEDFFGMLKVQPVAGRLFGSADFQSAQSNLALLSQRLWKRRFDRSADIIGQTIKLNGSLHTVIGIVPEAVEAVQERIDVWVPLIFTPDSLQNREARPYAIYARLRPDISVETARAEMQTMVGRLAADSPSLYRHLEIWLTPLGQRFGEDSWAIFRFLLITAGTILLIACANLASLLLVRSVHRGAEICLRSALGASRSRLIRQLSSESLLLACVGGAAGLLLARWGIDLLFASFPPTAGMELPSFIRFHLDWRVIGFALAISLLSGMLFGLVPSVEASKVNLMAGLQMGGRDSGGGRQARRLSQIFVVTQVAICFATVMFTAICFKSLDQWTRIDPGFKANNLLTVEMNLAGPDFTTEARRIAFLEQLLERARSVPGVRAAASADALPFAGPRLSQISVAGRPSKGASELVVYAADVGPDYFRTLGIPLLKGRMFAAQDNARAVPTAIVSQSLAAKLFGKTRDPIGQRIQIRGAALEIEIIGVVPNVLQATLGTIQSETRNLYLSHLQACGPRAMLVVRADQNLEGIGTALRRIVSELNPELPLFAVQSMEALITNDPDAAFLRHLASCMALFSVLAVILAVVGVSGTGAYWVAQRTREFGIRMALGSTVSRIVALVTLHGMKPVLVGVIFGFFANQAFVRPIAQALFYNLAANIEAWMILDIGLLLVLSMGVACLLPARRAAKVDPMEALRYE